MQRSSRNYSSSNDRAPSIYMLGLAACGLAACGFDGKPGAEIDAPAASDAASVDAAVDAAPRTWWDLQWSKRQRISIVAAEQLAAGYQVGIRVDLEAPPCGGNRDQVRIVHDHLTELPRVIDDLIGVNDEVVWFETVESQPAMIGDTKYWMYCGNASPPPAPNNGTEVFLLFDEFSGGTLEAPWVAMGSPTVSNGSAQLEAGDTFHSVAAFGAGHAMDFSMQLTNQTISSGTLWAGFELTFTTMAPWVVWIHRRNTTIFPEINQNDMPPFQTGAPHTLTTNPTIYTVEHHGNSGRFLVDHANPRPLAYNGGAIAPPLNVRFHNFDAAGIMDVGMARVRRIVDPAPTVTLGPVEDRPSE